MTNPFTTYAESRHVPAPVRRKMSRAQERARIKVLDEQGKLLKLWKKHNHQRINAFLEQHGARAARLIYFLGEMDITKAEELIAHVKSGPWRGADEATRFTVLHLIDTRIAALREDNGMAPYDDSFPELGEPQTAFEIIRSYICG